MKIHIISLFALILATSACVKSDFDAIPAPAFLPPSLAVDSLFEDFNNVSKVDGQIPTLATGWLNVSINDTAKTESTKIYTASRGYQTSIMTEFKTSKQIQCLQGTAYLAMRNADAWLVLPPVKVTSTHDSLTFSAALAFTQSSNAPAILEVRVLLAGSEDAAPTSISLKENGWQLVKTVTTSTLLDITTNKPITDWFRFGTVRVDLKTVPGYDATTKNIAYIAIRYKGKAPSSSSWYIDNVKFN